MKVTDLVIRTLARQTSHGHKFGVGVDQELYCIQILGRNTCIKTEALCTPLQQLLLLLVTCAGISRLLSSSLWYILELSIVW